MPCLRFSSCLLLSALLLPAQDLKEFEKRVTEFSLPNGLHFILLERHESPVISFHTFVNAGSAQDPGGQTGIARLLERLALKGTESIGTLGWPAEKKALDAIEEAYDRAEAEAAKGVRADQIRVEMLRNQVRLAIDAAQRTQMPNEYSRLLQENGATAPAATAGNDFTTLAYSLPSSRMELWFLMESQRLLHPVFREFYKERQAMADEYRQDVEQNPQARLLNEFVATAFKAHPYRNPVGGWPGDIQNLRRGDAQQFFERCYVPGNITFSIVGDVNPADARKMAERYFGPMAARPLPTAPPTVEPPQAGPKTVVMESPGPPLVVVGYKRPNQYDRDDLTLDVLQFLLSQGTTGLLYHDLVEERHLASQARVSATFPAGVYPNLIAIYLLPAAGRTIDENLRALDDVLQRVKTVPVDEQTLARAKAQLRALFMKRIATNDAIAGVLAVYSAHFGDWRKMFTLMDDLGKITADHMQRAAAKYFVPQGRTTAYTVAPGQSGRDLTPRPQAPPAERKTGGLQ